MYRLGNATHRCARRLEPMKNAGALRVTGTQRLSQWQLLEMNGPKVMPRQWPAPPPRFYGGPAPIWLFAQEKAHQDGRLVS